MDRFFLIGVDEIPSLVKIAAGEKLRWTAVFCPDLRGRNADALKSSTDITFEFEGAGAELDIACLYVCRGDDDFRFKINVRHEKGGSVSRQLFKGIVSENSRAFFDGLVFVRKDAQKTKAYQENHTILLDRGARVETRPQLEIYADDVKCSHGATTGYLNEDEQFYMRSRGISREEARRLQIISFLSPVLERVPQEVAERILEKL